MKRIMWGKMTNANLKNNELNIYLISIMLLIIVVLFSLFLLVSCRPVDDTNKDIINTNSGDKIEEGGLYLFDYRKIELDKTSAIDIEIKNCNLYIDIYEELVIMGEVENVSTGNKTDIEITLDFHNKNGEKIISKTIPAFVNYLRAGSRLPFYYYLDEKDKYIEISIVKIGVNYKSYNEMFKGSPIVKSEKYYYSDDGSNLIIEGTVVNIGSGKIRNLKLFCTFYNSKDRVVFIKKCYLLREEMIPEEEQKFTLEVLFDEYLPEFTDYRFEVFFEDEIKTPV